MATIHDPALIKAARQGTATLGAIFGGQGLNNVTGLDDLIHLQGSHDLVVRNLLDAAAETLLHLSSLPHKSGFHRDLGLDLRAWLDDPKTSPGRDYLSLAPISFPINTLLSLAQYCVLCSRLRLHPGQVRDLFKGGLAGHSQGLIAAIAVAKSTDWTSFYQASNEALQISFWVGLESHCAAPTSTISAPEVQDCISFGEGSPSSMLSVTGLDRSQVTQLLHQVNGSLTRKAHGSTRDQVYIALVNSPNRIILGGPRQSLRAVCHYVRGLKASNNMDRTRTMLADRRPDVGVQFMPVSAPFHTEYLKEVHIRIKEHIPAGSSLPTGRDLGIPVFHTGNGQNLQDVQSEILLEIVVRAVSSEILNWPPVIQAITRAKATHLLDFGPGQVGRLVHEATEGTGLCIIHIPGGYVEGTNPTEHFDVLSSRMPPPVPNWGREFSPRVVRDNEGRLIIETKMTKVFRAPHIMVAGMTPTTVHWDVVSAIMKAGYHAELAGGGYLDKETFRSAILQLARSIGAHRAITFNLLYAKPTTIAWQISTLRSLVREGVPIDGITIGAGIPSPEVVKEYIEELGLRHISFKPGSEAAIHQVVQIAQTYPHFPIGLQWTGGRAGGHHSWEDLHDPILKTYGRIRRCSNIVLIIGGGFGGGLDTWPYISGEWAHSLGYPSMPFDGVLMGSRLMVAREAHTSIEAKKLIVAADGASDSEWKQSFSEPTGGVVTVNSEMGQPIHVLATRGMMLWKELDRRVFSIQDPAKRKGYLHLHREEILSRLNADAARPWFAVDAAGRNIELSDMTYLEVLRRLCQLLYVHQQRRWIDSSYIQLVKDFVQLAEDRLGHHNGCSAQNPEILIREFEDGLGSAVNEIMYPEDVALLMALFRRPKQKPVAFIPSLDDDFETWFKKDSLWQSEDTEAVFDQDPQRIFIIQGPVAAGHSTSYDVSVRDILGTIYEAHLKLIQTWKGQTNGDYDSLVQTSDKESDKGMAERIWMKVADDGLTKRYQLTTDNSPSARSFLVEHIIGHEEPWAAACVADQFVSRGAGRVKNPVRDAFQPQAGDMVETIWTGKSALYEIKLIPYTSARNSKLQAPLSLSSKDQHTISIRLTPPGLSQRPEVEFLLRYKRDPYGGVLCEDAAYRMDKVNTLYSHLWLDDHNSTSQNNGIRSEFIGDEFILLEQHLEEYMNVIRRNSPSQMQGWDPRGSIPIDYCLVVAWTALIKPLMMPVLKCDFLKLLHRSITFRYQQSSRTLSFGDAIRTYSRITALSTKPNGRLIQVTADIKRREELVLTVATEFFVQGNEDDPEEQFISVQEPEIEIEVANSVTEALLISREWLFFDDPSADLVGKTILFRPTTQSILDHSGNIALLHIQGDMILAGDSDVAASRCGRIDFEYERSHGNPVMDFLRRHGAARGQRQDLDNPGGMGLSPVLLRAPSRSAPYAAASRDTNPIHTCPIFARYAGLPGTVLHGAHVSALARRVVEWSIGDRDRTRFRGWHASFESIVQPDDLLRVECSHVAMREGRMVLAVRVYNDQTEAKVLEAEAEVEQPRTAYVFCGQGSQQVGMGMSLYADNTQIKALWDRSDSYLRENYGFSILQIVRDNPKTLVVHFGGKQGRRVRDNYLSMTKRVKLPDGKSKHEPVLKNLTTDSRSYTFSDPAGLLMSTQFSQPALALVGMAEFLNLQTHGVAQQGARFAGHSLGEYAALGACTTFMSFERLLSLIFYRGLKMQNALPRDADGGTGYSMMAVNPSRISRQYDESHLQTLVHLIGEESELFLEVVNHNVQSQQYVCAGNVRTLWILSEVCDALYSHVEPEDMGRDTLLEIIRSKVPAAQSLPNNVSLSRGKATIPLSGIDIPFHSTMLRGAIDDYREYLTSNIRTAEIKPDELVGRWIPNVVGQPFSLQRSYVQRVFEITGSQHLERLLRRMED